MRVTRIVLNTFFLVVVFTLVAYAGMNREDLARESEFYCQSTVKPTPTSPTTIVAKVNEACMLLSIQGPRAFSRFKGKGSPFIYNGTYIWVHSLKKGIMLMHPIKYKLEGNDLIGLKDANDKRFFVIMNDVVSRFGEGWVEYTWPKPGTDIVVRKISFVKKCTMPGGEEVVVGSGIYNGDENEIAQLTLY